MFCPKCATQNIDGAKFCRSCGADISLVPQAMTGEISAVVTGTIENNRESRRKGRRDGPPSLERGIKNAFMGLGFLFLAIALAFSRVGTGWWFWMLIPAFSMLGGGVAEYMRSRSTKPGSLTQSIPTQTSIPRAPQISSLPPLNTSELVAPPPSVTEGTTRHLGAEGPTRVFAPAERPKQNE